MGRQPRSMPRRYETHWRLGRHSNVSTFDRAHEALRVRIAVRIWAIWLENGPIRPEMVPNCLLMACFSLVSSQDRTASVAPTRACRLR